jgi:hypothetical protein
MDIFEVSAERDTAQNAIPDFETPLSDEEKLTRSQEAHAAYMRTLFPNLPEAHMKYLIWPQSTLAGVCL